MNDKIREIYDAFYEKNDWKDVPQITRFKLQAILKILKVIDKNYPKTVLDVGCGTGLYSHIFRNMGFQVYGFDFSKKAIEKARKKYNIDFRILDGYALDYPVKFDLIFAKGFSPFNTDDFTKTNQLVDYWSKYLNNNGNILIVTRTNFSGKSPTGWKFLDEEGINSLYNGKVLKKEIVYFWSKFWVLIHIFPVNRFVMAIVDYFSKNIVARIFNRPVSVYIFLTKDES